MNAFLWIAAAAHAACFLGVVVAMRAACENDRRQRQPREQ